MVATRYLLDTNVLSEPVRPRPNLALVEQLAPQDAEPQLDLIEPRGDGAGPSVTANSSAVL